MTVKNKIHQLRRMIEQFGNKEIKTFSLELLSSLLKDYERKEEEHRMIEKKYFYKGCVVGIAVSFLAGILGFVFYMLAI